MKTEVDDKGFWRSYLIGAAIVWTGIFLATAILLTGSPAYG